MTRNPMIVLSQLALLLRVCMSRRPRSIGAGNNCTSACPVEKHGLVLESTAPDPDHPNDALRTVHPHPEGGARSLNPPGRPAPTTDLMDDSTSIRESPAPKGRGKGKGKSKGDEGKGESTKRKDDKGKTKGKGKSGDRTRSPPSGRRDGLRRRLNATD